MSHFDHDDPRLTAYVLGELEPAERAAVERLLAESAEAQAAVADIRRLTDELSDQLCAEPMPALTLAQRENVMSEPRKSTPPRPTAAPSRAGNAPVVLAACLMLLAVGGLIMYGGKTEPESSKPMLADSSRSMEGGTSVKDSLAAVTKLSGYQGNTALEEKRIEELERHAQRQAYRRAVKDKLSVIVRQSQKVHSQPQQGQGQQSGGVTSFSTLGRPTRTSTATLGVPPGQVPHPFSGSTGGRGWAYDARYANGLIHNPTGGKFFDTPPSRRLPALDFYKKGGTIAGLASPDRLNAGLDLSYHRNRGEEFLYERMDRLSKRRLGRLYLDGNQNDLSENEKLAKPGTPHGEASTTPAKAKAPEFFKKSHVTAYRKNVDAYFLQLAKQLPKRELAVMRVKSRLDGKLALLEGLVERNEAAGEKIPVAKGEEVVVKILDAELGDVDFDGDGRKDFSAEAYDTIVENEFLTPLADPLSTFSIDVDTASYSNTRRYLAHGQLPPRDAVRIEELVNYFTYDYPQPKSDKDPFSVTLETGVCPWNSKHRLVLIGLKGRELPHDKRPASNLVFLIDVSGSMSSANKLPLVKMSLEMLADEMTPNDKISIVTYAGSSKVVLEPTNADKAGKEKIITAIHSLNAGGSTNGASGIKMAYDQAKKGFIKKGANRVVLCTDGDFNVGISDDNDLVKLIQNEAKSNVFLSVFGFGMGNLKDAKLEKLADKGNGHYGYIDGFREAKKVFVEELTGMLYTIAKDVKIQVEFNPSQVGSYRLVGYENRMLAAQDFNDDKKDAGEIGAGHTVTALYEIVPKSAERKPAVDALKYQQRVAPSKDKPVTQELLTVKLRYKQPDGDKSTKMEFPLTDKADAKKAPSENFDWASAVAMYGLLLRESKYSGESSLDLVRELAAGSMGKDPEGHRSEFLKLVHQTRTLVARKLGKPVPAPRAFEAGALDAK